MSRTRKMTGWRIEAGVRTDGDMDDASLKQAPRLPTECGTMLGVGCDTAQGLGRVIQDTQFQAERGTDQLKRPSSPQKYLPRM